MSKVPLKRCYFSLLLSKNILVAWRINEKKRMSINHFCQIYHDTQTKKNLDQTNFETL